MKRLIIKKLTIVSQAEQKAKIIEFDPKLTVITSEDKKGKSINRTGKSLVMKSIYHAMGASLKQYTTNWSYMNICTIIEFLLDDVDYTLFRYNDKFILRDCNKLLKKFESVSELKNYYVDFFNFNMKLSQNNSQATYLYPGAVFMPFYIDQDKGWPGEWGSFSDIFKGAWKKEILLFHLGVKPNKYYELIDEQAEINNRNQKNKNKQNLLQEFYDDQFERSSNYLDVNVKIDDFADEIVRLTYELNSQLDKKNEIKAEIVSCFNRMNEIELLYGTAKKNLSELVEDIKFININVVDDQITCPTCGAIHENSMTNRFMMFHEVEQCNKIIDSYFNERKVIEKIVDDKETELESLSEYIDRVNDILERKRNNVTLKDVIRHEGAKTVLLDIKTNISNLHDGILKDEGRLKEIRTEKTKITKEGNNIQDQYFSKLKDNLSYLDVNDIDPKTINKFHISLKCGGNDTPCAIISQIYALFDIANKHSKSVIGPIVLDAIFQQEPAKLKIQKIWDFVVDKQPVNSQLIVSTTVMHGKNLDGKVIPLLEERGLLKDSDYEKSLKTLNQFKSILLS